ncbi:MAG: DUF7305 domain-containing protein [Myxococcota bacterium]
MALRLGPLGSRSFVFVPLFLVLGCSNCDPAVAVTADGGEAGTGSDSTPGTGGGGNTLADGGVGDGGGSGTNGSDDGGATDGDGGILAEDPFEQALDDFCAGQGAVVSTSGTGSSGQCAGDLAESIFRWAICACDTITTGGANASISTDAFDSDLGAYADQTPSDDGHVGVNGIFPEKSAKIGGSLHIGNEDNLTSGPVLNLPNGGAFIRGNLYAFGSVRKQGSTMTVSGDVFSSGALEGTWEVGGSLYQPVGVSNGQVNKTPTAATIPQILPCPCGDELPLDGGIESTAIDPAVWADPNAGPAELSLPCGRYYFSSIDRGSGAATIIAEGRVVIMVGGDMKVGGLNVVTSDGSGNAEIDLFVAGNLLIDGTGTFGNAARPNLVRTYVGGNVVSIGAAAAIGGNFYAPHATFEPEASLKVFGSLFVNELKLNGNAEVHFDSAIRSAGDVCAPPPDGTVDGGPADGGGSAGVDAGADGGSGGSVDPSLDGGTLPGIDAGLPLDGGSAVDSGTPPPPPGPECSGRCDLGACGAGEACLLDATTGDYGVCGACATSLDCCAPQVCLSGQCADIGG